MKASAAYIFRGASPNAADPGSGPWPWSQRRPEPVFPHASDSCWVEVFVYSAVASHSAGHSHVHSAGHGRAMAGPWPGHGPAVAWPRPGHGLGMARAMAPAWPGPWSRLWLGQGHGTSMASLSSLWAHFEVTLGSWGASGPSLGRPDGFSMFFCPMFDHFGTQFGVIL